MAEEVSCSTIHVQLGVHNYLYVTILTKLEGSPQLDHEQKSSVSVYIQVVADMPPQLLDSDQNALKVGSRVWLKDKDLYGTVRYVHLHGKTCA